MKQPRGTSRQSSFHVKPCVAKPPNPRPVAVKLERRPRSLSNLARPSRHTGTHTPSAAIGRTSGAATARSRQGTRSTDSGGTSRRHRNARGCDDRLAGPRGHRPLRATWRHSRPSQEAADTGLRQVAGAYFEEVAVGSITPNPRQPRRTFDEEALEELAASITEVGLLQPVVVRKLGEGKLRARHGRAPLARVAAGGP